MPTLTSPVRNSNPDFARRRPRGCRRADLRGALARLVAGGDVPDHVRGHIGASWRRSVESGLIPQRVDVPFDPEVEANGLLVRAARPVLDQLAVDLSGARVAVLLADEGGQVVDRRVSEPSLLAHLDRILLAPGFVYAEDVVGTNGMGTALAQGTASAVEGEEHFADALTTVACAGAPISDPRSGRTVGVLDLTCLAGEGSALTLPFANRAARDVEQRLVDDARVGERLMIQRFLQERRRAKGPLVFITERTMLTNAAADRLVEPEDELLLRDWAGRSGTGELVLSRGTAVTVRSEPVGEGGARAVTILRLQPSRPAARRGATFGWESLTETERSVVELVAQGLTNREAAERLFLSHHTVGFHLRSIYRKLGVGSPGWTSPVSPSSTAPDRRRAGADELVGGDAGPGPPRPGEPGRRRGGVDPAPRPRGNRPPPVMANGDGPGRRLVRFWRKLGPGLVTGASDNDPSGITTYSVAGASTGYRLLWLAVATLPLLVAVQSMA
ncbi:MAG: LuxR C-terminal-related transcriptional regulator, partial [Actinomycetota bacterium]|nr:LuxR C-terminal-related transcriptional regulator [Actinomycetota bacterium]